jgi:hypothetical protein
VISKNCRNYLQSKGRLKKSARRRQRKKVLKRKKMIVKKRWRPDLNPFSCQSLFLCVNYFHFSLIFSIIIN